MVTEQTPPTQLSDWLPLDDAAPPTDADAHRRMTAISVDRAARVEVVVMRYVDRAPIRAIQIVDDSGRYITLDLGYTIAQEISLAERFIDAFSEWRDGAVADRDDPDRARKVEP